MKIVKFLFIAVAILLAIMLGLSVVGFFYSGLWYLIGVGIITLGGYSVYKFIKFTNKLELEGRDTVSQIDYDNDISIKQLESYKRKLLK
jgi:hypothetical protein